MLGETPENAYSLEKEGAQRASAKPSGGQRRLGSAAQILQHFPQKASPRANSSSSHFSTGPCCPSRRILGNDDQVNRNTPLNLIWETVQCPHSLLTPYSCGRMHTGEVPPPLPAAAGEATTSPWLPNRSTAAATATELCPTASTRTCGTAPCCSQLHEGFGT